MAVTVSTTLLALIFAAGFPAGVSAGSWAGHVHGLARARRRFSPVGDGAPPDRAGDGR